MNTFELRPEDFSPQIEVAATYVSAGGKLLFLKLGSSKSEAGAWGVPAGKLKLNESPISGARRELFEETGIHIPEEALLHALGQLFIRKPDIDYVYHLFSLNLEQKPEIQLSSEHSEYKWVTQPGIETLPLMKGAKEALLFYYRELP